MFTIIGGDGKEYGPASVDQIRAWITAGRANLDTKAKAVGSDEWRRLGDFAEFGAAGGLPPLAEPTTLPPAATFTATTTPVLELAGRGTRLAAAIIDRLFVLLCLIPGLALMGPALVQMALASQRGEEPDLEAFGAGGALLGAGFTMLALLALIIVQVWMISTRGQSLGKRFLGIRIVKFADNARPGFVHGWLLRDFVTAVISAVPYVGTVFALVDVCFIFGEQRRCIHDLIAGTKVVKA
jgi:uncharacterized RDD family membrane protein YckC